MGSRWFSSVPYTHFNTQQEASRPVNHWAHLMPSVQFSCPERWEGVVNASEERAEGQWDRTVLSCPEKAKARKAFLEVMDRKSIPSPVDSWKVNHSGPAAPENWLGKLVIPELDHACRDGGANPGYQ